MKQLLRWSLVAPLLVLLIAAPVSAEDSGLFPFDYVEDTLDNGLRVILVPMSSGGLASYWTIVRTGSRDEYEPGRSGFAHFFEHMMFRGTDKYPGEVYNEMLTEMGADTNAYTSDDITAYHLAIAAEDIEKVMELESDRFMNLNYPEAQFKTEAGAVYGEYRKNRSNPFFVGYEAVREKAFDKHTYGHTTMGYERDIKNMPNMFDYSRSFFDRYYRPDNCVLLIAGDIDVAATRALVDKYYGDWEPGYVEPKIVAEPAQTAEKKVVASYPGRTLPIVWMGYKFDAMDPSDKSVAAGFVLGDLAFGSTSELYKKLVLEDQLVEFIQGGPNINRDPGLFDVITRIKDPAKVDEVIAIIDAAIEKVKNEAPDEARLDGVKSNFRYSFLMGLDTPNNVAQGLARPLAVMGSLKPIEQMYATLDSLTPEDIQEAANKYFQVERRTVAQVRGEE